MGGNYVSWYSKCQSMVSQSFMEAEYKALAFTTTETMWILHVLHNHMVLQIAPTKLFCDNLNGLHLSTELVHHGRTKHTKMDYHFVRKKVAQGSLITTHVLSLQQVGNLFMKSLYIVQFLFLYSILGLTTPRM